MSEEHKYCGTTDVDGMFRQIEDELRAEGLLDNCKDVCGWCGEEAPITFAYVGNHYEGTYCKDCHMLVASCDDAIDRDQS